MSVNHDGAPLFAISSPHGENLMVNARAHDGRLHAHVVDTLHGNLVMTPVVNETAYSYVVQKDDGTLSVVRHENRRGLDGGDDDHDDRDWLGDQL